MDILSVIRESVLALFSNPMVANLLYLKGGTALHISENLDSRLSTDIDFSTPSTIESATSFFQAFGESLAQQFQKFGYEVIDDSFKKRPSRKKKGTPEVWGGWEYTFKLSRLEHHDATSQQKSRWALIPEGSSSSIISIQISENEYCVLSKTILINEVEIQVYSAALLILEKIRAICQQHPNYEFSGNKNRARDFYDIYGLYRKYRRDDDFFKVLKSHIKPVFDAKKVPLEHLDLIFEPDFLSRQGAGFLAVRDTVRGRVESFNFYAEQLRFLIQQLR